MAGSCRASNVTDRRYKQPKSLSDWVMPVLGAALIAGGAMVWSTKADAVTVVELRKDLQYLQLTVAEIQETHREEARQRAEEAQQLLNAYRAATGRKER